MELFDLCSLQSTTPTSGSVPAWTLGCFRRRSITFFNGDTDDTTLVLWMQSRGLTGDLRLAADRPRPTSRAALAELAPADLLRLCDVEGGISPTRFEVSGTGVGLELAGTMHWPDWTAFQLHDKWPEPGSLRRVGDCLLEYAPSGAYVEDWRLQAGGGGPLIGLSLLDERDAKGNLLHRGGGLLVAGEHAMLVRGRAQPLPAAARLNELLERAAREPSLLDAIFGFEASYARRDPSGRYVVVASTLPWREGQPLMALGGFALDGGQVLQRARENNREVVRRFQVDTLEVSYEDWLATPTKSSAASWLQQEERTLLRAARKL
jgi:hypothetical protein